MEINGNILTPTIEGNWLTDGEAYGKIIYLGNEASAENWREVTGAEKAAAEMEYLSYEKTIGDIVKKLEDTINE